MNTATGGRTEPPRSWWEKLHRKVVQFENAMDYNPLEHLHHRVDELQRRLAALEAQSAKRAGG